MELEEKNQDSKYGKTRGARAAPFLDDLGGFLSRARWHGNKACVEDGCGPRGSVRISGLSHPHPPHPDSILVPLSEKRGLKPAPPPVDSLEASFG